ncbi:MAG: response regulator [Clostridium sp.]|nr:response regulator [Clostridium sp.]
MKDRKRSNITGIAAAGAAVVLVILVLGTIWMGQSARKDTQDAVRTVSNLYLDELAGRREQVVESNLQNKIRDLRVAVSLMEQSDLSDMEHLQNYQSRMKQLYNLDKFAFVDSRGRIYTTEGMQTNIDDYSFDYKTLSGPEVSILNLDTPEKKVVIAVPVELSFEAETLTVCFMEIDMQEMLSGVSMASNREEVTFCNIYTRNGVALSNTVLGGLAAEDNLLDAMKQAEYEQGYSFESFLQAFKNGERGETSFNYKGIDETLSFVHVRDTDWMLTYLIRESVLNEKISTVTAGIITKSIIQSVATVAAMGLMFGYIILQSRKNTKLRLEQETAEAENRARQEEMEHRLALQEKLLEEEKRRTQQDQMITAMASDYRSVYHVDLDTDEAVCYRADPEDPDHYTEGQQFAYLEAFTSYGKNYVAENYRKGFLEFVDPANIRQALEHEKILAYRYLVHRGGKEYYEMLRMAGVRHPEDREDHVIHAIGIGFTVIDAEMRRTMAEQQALSDALMSAEEANKAKTAFLSSMSHEIRTPMNAIIGLDNIALNDPETPEKTRDYLEKIGSSAEHLLNLINDILDMSRIESGRMALRNEEFSFRKLMEAINTMFSSQCQEKGLEYQCRILGDVDDYYIGDNMKLRQVLINILGNAVKFTPEGGSVSLQVERKGRFDRKSALCFTISDTGIGMSPDFLPHLFDAFTQEDGGNTSRYGSSGLGLAITKNIVEMMNGTIEAESEKGKGTTFTVNVTLADSERRDDEEEDVEIHPGEMSVLIVDDDPVACSHGKLVLEKAGIYSEIAESGSEAVDMVRVRHARRDPYNLILVDWKMPEMDGVECTRRIREIVGNESAIIILTAYRWDDVLEEAMQAGVDSFIPKPLFAAAVLEEFRAALRRKGGAAGKKVHKAELSGRRILLAEDVQINAEIIIMILQSRGMEIDHAENGKICVETFASHEEGYYDAILMDVRMPEMDGLEATKTIRAMDRPDAGRIPIIALTANAFDEDVQRSLMAGMNAHLSKPVQADVLFETLENLIRD